MPHIVTATAQLHCDKGAAPSSLKVTSQHYSCYDDKPIATEQDKAPEANIPSFGTCTITRSRCTPAPLGWDSPAEKEEIDGMRVLAEGAIGRSLGASGCVWYRASGLSGLFSDDPGSMEDIGCTGCVGAAASVVEGVGLCGLFLSHLGRHCIAYSGGASSE